MKTDNIKSAIYRNLPLFFLYVVLLAGPCCLKWDEGSFHFAKVFLVTGFICSLSIAFVLYLLSIYARGIKYVISAVLWILFFIEIFVFAHFHNRLNDRSVYLVLQTDANECSEFLSSYILRTATLAPIIASSILGVAYCWLRNWWHKHGTLRVLRKKWCVGLILFSLAASSVFNIYTWSKKTSNAATLYYVAYPTVVQLWISASLISEYAVDNRRLEEVIGNSDGELTIPAEFAPHVVFVIGESFNPNHSSLYGYPINTTPHMVEARQKGDLVVFTDAVTPSASTGIMMNILFSAAPVEAQQDRWDYPLIPAIFKHAGYYVALHDNQSTKVHGDITWDVTNCQFFNSDKVAKYSLDYRNMELNTYDLDFVKKELCISEVPQSAMKFDIYHLMGQHYPAAKRYPHDFSMPAFDYTYRKELTPQQKNELEHYDKATFYNDVVIGEIFDSVENTDAIVVYVSDHGEEIHDFRNQYGRTLEPVTRDIAQNIFRVPLVIYTTPIFRERHPEIYQEIIDACKKPIYTGDLGHLLMHVGSVKSRFYNQERDPLSGSYISRGRRILNSEKDYDAL